MKTEKPHLIALKTANRETLQKRTCTLTNKYMDPLLCEISQKAKAYHYDNTIIKIYLVTYPNSIRIE